MRSIPACGACGLLTAVRRAGAGGHAPRVWCCLSAQGSTELCTPAEVASLNLHFKLSRCAALRSRCMRGICYTYATCTRCEYIYLCAQMHVWRRGHGQLHAVRRYVPCLVTPGSALQTPSLHGACVVGRGTALAWFA